ncbi:MAG TPA: hypothetical protein VIM73_06280 [Polyangiaceae bacterium]
MRYSLTVLVSGLLTVVTLGVCLSLFPMNVHDQSYAMYAQAKDASLARSTKRSPLLVLGDSRPKAAILPNELGPDVELLALTGGTPIEAFYTLERYLSGHPAPERILISIAAVHFKDGFVFWERTVKYDFLTRAQYEEVLSLSESLHDDIFGSPLEARWKLFAYRNKLLHVYLPELHSALIQLNRGSKNRLLYQALERDRGHCWFGTRERDGGAAYETGHARFEVAPTFDRYFRRLLDRALSTGARVTFAAMPLNPRSRAALSAKYVADYEAYFARIARAYPRIRFDYVWPVLPEEDFGDPNHVNARGARKVSARVRTLVGL